MTWRPAPLPYGAPCTRPPGGLSWRPYETLSTASGVASPPIRLSARREVLHRGSRVDPDIELPADILDRVRAVSEAWARWIEADQAAERDASAAPIAGLAGYFGAEQFTRHYTERAHERAASAAHDCTTLALDATLLTIDLRDHVAHTLSWRRGGGGVCEVGAPPDVTLIGTAHCAGELRLRYYAWALIEGEWLMTGAFVAGGRHAPEMRAFAAAQSSVFAPLMWRLGHYLDRIEAEYDASGRPCD